MDTAAFTAWMIKHGVLELSVCPRESPIAGRILVSLPARNMGGRVVGAGASADLALADAMLKQADVARLADRRDEIERQLAEAA